MDTNGRCSIAAVFDSRRISKNVRIHKNPQKVPVPEMPCTTKVLETKNAKKICKATLTWLFEFLPDVPGHCGHPNRRGKGGPLLTERPTASPSHLQT